MDVVRSREFLVALLCFLTPVAMSAVLVYRRVRKSVLPCSRVQVNQAAVRRVPEQAVVQPAPGGTKPAPALSLQQSLENLRESLLAFRGSIQNSHGALGDLQECDYRFSMDLNRASEVMQNAFSK